MIGLWFVNDGKCFSCLKYAGCEHRAWCEQQPVTCDIFEIQMRKTASFEREDDLFTTDEAWMEKMIPTRWSFLQGLDTMFFLVFMDHDFLLFDTAMPPFPFNDLRYSVLKQTFPIIECCPRISYLMCFLSDFIWNAISDKLWKHWTIRIGEIKNVCIA